MDNSATNPSDDSPAAPSRPAHASNEQVPRVPPSPRTNGSASRSRKRTRSVSSRSSSSTSCDSSSSSSTSSSSSNSVKSKCKKRRPRRHRRHHKKGGGKRNRRRKNELVKLKQKVGELQKQVVGQRENAFSSNNVFEINNCLDCENENDELLDDSVSGILYEQIGNEPHESDLNQGKLQINLDLETKLKEPTVPKASQAFLDMLGSIQHFEKEEWSEVRYAEVQKLYNQTPGFIDLEANEEIRPYDQLRHLAHTDKAYAALTLCVLKQREALKVALQSLLLWSREQGNSSGTDSLLDRLNELFCKGEYSKVSTDLLQLVCGHRAEAIQMRRDGIIKSVRDPLTKFALRRVPPSNRNLFSAAPFTTVLEKAGGVKKAFTLNKPLNNVSASQAGTNKATCHPSQGSTNFHRPSQGTNCRCCAALPHQVQKPQPSQGPFYSHPSQGSGNYSVDRRPGHSSRGSFRPRGGGKQNNKYQGQYKDNRKRPGGPSNSNLANKKKKVLTQDRSGQGA